MTRVVVFAKPGCARCRQAQKILRRLGVEFEVLDPEANADNLALYAWCDPTDHPPRCVLLDTNDKVLASCDGSESVHRFAQKVLDMGGGV